MGDTQIAQGELSKYDYILHKFIVMAKNKVFFQEHVCVLIYTLLYLYCLMKVYDYTHLHHKVTHNN